METAMLKRIMRLGGAAVLAAAVLCAPSKAADGTLVNALLVVPSAQTVFDKKFQDFLETKGVKLLQSHPPSVFVGYIPKELDGQLKEKYGALVYRDKVDDWGAFARYGENAVFAVNAWNKRFLDAPSEAPLVVSTKVRQAGRKGDALELTWNEVMKASVYRLQISRDETFGTVLLDTVVARNSYKLVPAFWKDGVYYWRVAGILTLNNGEPRDGAFSEVYSFAVSKAYGGGGEKLAAPPVPAKTRVTDRPLSWASSRAFRYYRLQLSETPGFDAPLLDVFTDTCSYKLSGLPVERGALYYMRVKGSDGTATGAWSEVSEIIMGSAGSKVSGGRVPKAGRGKNRQER